MADDFVDLALDQLGEPELIRAKRMFGGYGLYDENIFFGIIYKQTLFFKTDKQTRRIYLDCGMKPFQPSARQTLASYYAVPVDVIENPVTLKIWAKAARAVAAQTKKEESNETKVARFRRKRKRSIV